MNSISAFLKLKIREFHLSRTAGLILIERLYFDNSNLAQGRNFHLKRIRNDNLAAIQQ
jgi:hypothetical protein